MSPLKCNRIIFFPLLLLLQVFSLLLFIKNVSYGDV
jgi:hypothetical protein